MSAVVLSKSLHLVLVPSILMSAGLASAQFADVTTTLLGDPGNSYCVTWTDYDGDGDLDIYLVNSSRANKLFRNDGDHGFVDATSPPLNQRGGHSASWGDYDNDGDLDLIHLFGPNRLFRNDREGGFVDVASGVLAHAGLTDAEGNLVRSGLASAAPWADYDRDGDLDLFLVRNGPNKLLRNDGNDLFADVTTRPLRDPKAGTGIAWADYDNDGDLDLLFVSQTSLPRPEVAMLFRNDAGGTFVDVTPRSMGDSTACFGPAWGDCDNDGDLDLYLAKVGPNRLFRNDGGDRFVDVSAGPLADPGYGLSPAWGDFDNDGDLDLYLTNMVRPDRLFRNDGDGVFVDATTPPLGEAVGGKSAAWGDYDKDGDLDLYLARYHGANKLYRNDARNANRWLHLDLEGVISNRSGIGARLRCVTGGQVQIREVSGGVGSSLQHSLTVEFGLGRATMVDTIEIRWPSGVVQTLIDLPVDTLLSIGETAPAGFSPRF